MVPSPVPHEANLSSPGLTGRSSTPRLIRSITDVSGILDCPLFAGNDSESTTRISAHASAFSRRKSRPSFASDVAPKTRGRRECRVLAAPMARLQKKSRRQLPQVQPKHPAFPARWF